MHVQGRARANHHKKKGGTRARRFLEKSIKPERLRGKGGEKDGKEDRIQRVAGVPGGEESEMRGLMKGSSSGKKDLKKRREIRKGRARLNFTATQTSNYIHKLDKRWKRKQCNDICNDFIRCPRAWMTACLQGVSSHHNYTLALSNKLSNDWVDVRTQRQSSLIEIKLNQFSNFLRNYINKEITDTLIVLRYHVHCWYYNSTFMGSFYL